MSTPRTHTVLKVQQKLDLVRRANSGEDIHKLALEFRIHVDSARRIRRKITDIAEFANTLPNGSQRCKMKITNHFGLENALYEWYCDKRTLGEPTSGPSLREQALLLNKKMDGPSDFKASSGWLRNFKKRHNIHHVSTEGEQRLEMDPPGVRSFVHEFEEDLDASDLDLENVYNMDESALCWRSLPKMTLAQGCEPHSVNPKMLNDRVTIGVCANSAGTHRIPLLFVGKHQHPRSFKHCQNNLPVTYRWNKKAWVTRDVFADWFENVFKPSVERFQLSRGTAGKVMLILDNSSSHIIPSAFDNMEKFQVHYLPPNTVSLIQPMEQGIITHLKRLFRYKMLLRVANAENIAEFYVNYDLKDCVDMIAESWAELTADNLSNAWYKILPTLVTNNNGAAVVIPSEEELATILKHMNEGITASDISTWHKEVAELENEPADSLMEEEDPLASEEEDSLDVLQAFHILKKWSARKPNFVKYQIDSTFSYFNSE